MGKLNSKLEEKSTVRFDIKYKIRIFLRLYRPLYFYPLSDSKFTFAHWLALRKSDTLTARTSRKALFKYKYFVFPKLYLVYFTKNFRTHGDLNPRLRSITAPNTLWPLGCIRWLRCILNFSSLWLGYKSRGVSKVNQFRGLFKAEGRSRSLELFRLGNAPWNYDDTRINGLVPSLLPLKYSPSTRGKFFLMYTQRSKSACFVSQRFVIFGSIFIVINRGFVKVRLTVKWIFFTS